MDHGATYIEQVATEVGLDEMLVEELFGFLDDLRDSGVTNMFGAAPYVREFADEELSEPLTRDKARKIVVGWMQSPKWGGGA